MSPTLCHFDFERQPHWGCVLCAVVLSSHQLSPLILGYSLFSLSLSLFLFAYLFCFLPYLVSLYSSPHQFCVSTFPLRTSCGSLALLERKRLHFLLRSGHSLLHCAGLVMLCKQAALMPYFLSSMRCNTHCTCITTDLYIGEANFFLQCCNSHNSFDK